VSVRATSAPGTFEMTLCFTTISDGNFKYMASSEKFNATTI
jgi:hypothetical protein